MASLEQVAKRLVNEGYAVFEKDHKKSNKDRVKDRRVKSVLAHLRKVRHVIARRLRVQDQAVEPAPVLDFLQRRGPYFCGHCGEGSELPTNLYKHIGSAHCCHAGTAWDAQEKGWDPVLPEPESDDEGEDDAEIAEFQMRKMLKEREVCNLTSCSFAVVALTDSAIGQASCWCAIMMVCHPKHRPGVASNSEYSGVGKCALPRLLQRIVHQLSSSAVVIRSVHVQDTTASLMKVHGHTGTRIKGKNGLESDQVHAKIKQNTDAMEAMFPVQTSDHDAALPEAPQSPDYEPSSAAALPDSANPHNEELLARAQAVDYAALPAQARDSQAQPAQPFVTAPSRGAAAAGTTKRQGKNGVSKQRGAAASSLPHAPTHFPAGMVRHNPGSLLCVLAAMAS